MGVTTDPAARLRAIDENMGAATLDDGGGATLRNFEGRELALLRIVLPELVALVEAAHVVVGNGEHPGLSRALDALASRLGGAPG